jgi:hypothetical protein
MFVNILYFKGTVYREFLNGCKAESVLSVYALMNLQYNY